MQVIASPNPTTYRVQGISAVDMLLQSNADNSFALLKPVCCDILPVLIKR